MAQFGGMQQQQGVPLLGDLLVTVIEARDLPSAGIGGGRADPYVEVHVGNMINRTNIIKHNLNPVWNQTFAVPAGSYNPWNDTVRILVFDWDRFTRNDLMCETAIPISRLLQNPVVDEWYPLSYVKGKGKPEQRGTIHIKLIYGPGLSSVLQTTPGQMATGLQQPQAIPGYQPTGQQFLPGQLQQQQPLGIGQPTGMQQQQPGIGVGQPLQPQQVPLKGQEYGGIGQTTGVGMQQPGLQQQGLQQPGLQQPGLQQPGLQQPGLQQPGLQQQGLGVGVGGQTQQGFTGGGLGGGVGQPLQGEKAPPQEGRFGVSGVAPGVEPAKSRFV